MKNKTEEIIFIIFFIIGIIFLTVGISVHFMTSNFDDKIKTSGIISEISSYRGANDERNHTVYVKYKVDEMEYESPLNYWSSSFYEGKQIDIYYSKSQPSKIGTKVSDLLFTLIFSGIGLIFILIGGIFLLVRYIKKSNYKKLKENGELIYANYLETIINRSYTVNGRHPFNIICEWNNPSDGKTYIFKSNNLWINPENIISERNINKFPVYIDLNSPKKYYLDINSVTEDVIDLT